LGQYKTALGNVEMLSYVRQGNNIICYAARLTPKSATGEISATVRVLGRWTLVDYGVGRIPAAIEHIPEEAWKFIEKWLGDANG
jgi:hypothetical protein